MGKRNRKVGFLNNLRPLRYLVSTTVLHSGATTLSTPTPHRPDNPPTEGIVRRPGGMAQMRRIPPAVGRQLR